MSANAGPGRGGIALYMSPGLRPRGVAFAPAVRGYPGGIADMAGDLDEYVADLSFDDDELWEPAAEAEPVDTAAAEPVDTAAAEPGDAAAESGGAAGPGDARSQAGPAPAEAGASATGEHVPAQQLPGEGSRPAPAPPVSVWQQSAAAWQEAGIDWTRPATAGPRPAGLAIEDDPHTEPIPALTADGSVRTARTGDKAGQGAGDPLAGSPSAGAGAPPGSPSAGRISAGASASPGSTPTGRPSAGSSSAGSPSAGTGASPGSPAAGSPAAGSPAAAAAAAAAGVTAAAVVNGAAAEAGAPTAAGTAAPSAATASAPGVAAGPAQAGRTAAHEGGAGTSVGAGAGGASAAAAASIAAGGATQAKPGKKAGPDKRKKAGPGQGKKTGPGQDGKTGPGQDGKAGPEQKTGPGQDDKAGPGQGGKPGPGRTRTGRARPGKRVTIVAVIALALVAGALAGVGIARSGGSARPEFTLVTPYPAAVPADTELAGRTAGVTHLHGSLTGIAAAGKTVVAIGAEPSQPAPAPLILYSADGGHTWARAALAGPGAAAGPGPGAAAGPGAAGSGAPAGPGLTAGLVPAGPGTTAGPGAAGGPGTAPVLIAHGGGTWLALGQYAAWASPDGRTWHPAPALPPVAGDTVLGLAATGSGFVAVGEHTGAQPGPVVWTSSAGRPWQRWTGPVRGLTPRSGHVTALRWVAADGAVVVAGGPIAGATGQGRRPYAGVWRSTDGGLTWRPVTLPASHGSTNGLAGLAATGTGFVAVRPGHAAGRLDAVTYRSAQGVNWRYAGKLTPVRRTSLQVTTVSGSDHGFVVAAAVRGSEVAFSSVRGRDWHRTTAGAGAGVAGLTAGPGGTVVVAGNSRLGSGAPGIRPHLILISPAAREQVGRAVLVASATPDVTVNGLAAAGRVLVAAGSAGGSPALWLASSGRWAPAGVLLPQAWRNGALVSVAHGGEGWLAIGRASAAPSAQAPVPSVPPASRPVVLTSATGTSWTPVSAFSPLTAQGNVLAQAAAGPAGYVVAGSARTSGTTAGGTTAGGTTAGGATAGGATAGRAAAPAAWYSKNLSTWAHATLPVPGSYVPAGAPGSRALAVTAAGPGFVAVGSAGNTPVAWTSANGSAWNFAAVPLPAGAAGAVLTEVTAQGTRAVAAGYAWRAGSAPVPFTAISADGGRTWRDARLPTPNAPAVVTALTATAHGFVAVGHTAPPGRPVMLAWWSSDGLTWQNGLPAGGVKGDWEAGGGPFVTQINALTGGNGTLTGAGFAASTAAEHPVLWHARYR